MQSGWYFHFSTFTQTIKILDMDFLDICWVFSFFQMFIYVLDLLDFLTMVLGNISKLNSSDLTFQIHSSLIIMTTS